MSLLKELVTAVPAVALVIVTFAQWSESKRDSKLSAIENTPLFEIKAEGFSNSQQGFGGLTVYFKNVGKTPALHTRVVFTFFGSGTTVGVVSKQVSEMPDAGCQIADSRLFFNDGCVGFGIILPSVEIQKVNVMPKIIDPEAKNQYEGGFTLWGEIRFDDVLGNKSAQLFAFDYDRSNPDPKITRVFVVDGARIAHNQK